MSVLDVRQAIVDGLKATLPAGVTVEAHRGRFDSAAEVQRFAVKSPIVLVSCVRMPVNDASDGNVMMPCSWALFVLTRDIPKLQRDAGALLLVEAVERSVIGNTWGSADASEPTGIDGRNLYSGSIDALGFALWVVTFDQLITTTLIDQGQLDAMAPFETFHQDIDVHPADGHIEISETDQLPQ
jgi:hypothetical protein